MRAAAEMDAAGRVDRERHDMIDVAPHDPFESVANADDVEPFEPRANGGSAHDAVDAGRGSAADQNREAVVMLHVYRVGGRAQGLGIRDSGFGIRRGKEDPNPNPYLIPLIP